MGLSDPFFVMHRKFGEMVKYGKHHQQAKAAFNERNPHTTKRPGAQEDQNKTRTGQKKIKVKRN
jgi:hypothetical protein